MESVAVRAASAAAATAAVLAVNDRPIDKIRRHLNEALIERGKEITVALVGMLSRQNVLVIGPPGTAKSMLCESVAKSISGVQYFGECMTKYTAPEAIFGPYRLSKLEEDIFERNYEGYMPAADIAFLDEVFKASSAVNNTLLHILNERRFKNGNVDIQTNLMFTMAGSNEHPVGEGFQEQAAFYDRFLIRVEVSPVSSGGRRRLMYDTLPPVTPQATKQDIIDAQLAVDKIQFSDQAKNDFDKVLQAISSAKVSRVGDRRLRLSTSACKAMAYLNGHSEVEPVDLEVLKDILWNDPTQAVEARKAVRSVANPDGEKLEMLLASGRQTIEDVNESNVIATVKKLNEIIKEVKKIPDSPTKEEVYDELEKLRKQTTDRYSGI